jgi:hypothetical protein
MRISKRRSFVLQISDLCVATADELFGVIPFIGNSVDSMVIHCRRRGTGRFSQIRSSFMMKNRSSAV